MSAAALGSHRATGRSITEQFHAFDANNPHVYRALERMAARRLAAGATRVSLKDLFEDLRRQLPHGVAGLNNNYTALYARRLIDEHPHWAAAFELRRRRAA
ncbi:hypothetical protein AB0M29_10990 [Streptomyces sp. NPDC051976]|uniref:hypothetical protein n=1 Tax=Streptomyces sp. NPDC051976 TaxID=3154947 RepID=UPI00343814CA